MGGIGIRLGCSANFGKTLVMCRHCTLALKSTSSSPQSRAYLAHQASLDLRFWCQTQGCRSDKCVTKESPASRWTSRMILDSVVVLLINIIAMKIGWGVSFAQVNKMSQQCQKRHDKQFLSVQRAGVIAQAFHRVVSCTSTAGAGRACIVPRNLRTASMRTFLRTLNLRCMLVKLMIPNKAHGRLLCSLEQFKQVYGLGTLSNVPMNLIKSFQEWLPGSSLLPGGCTLAET